MLHTNNRLVVVVVVVVVVRAAVTFGRTALICAHLASPEGCAECELNPHGVSAMSGLLAAIR